MGVYLIMLLASLALAAFSGRVQKKQRILLAVLSALPLTLLSAIRYDVGTDYFYTYAPGFDQIVHQYGYQGLQYEPGFRLLNIVIARFTGDYAWLFAITSILFGAFTYYHLYKQSANVCLSIFLYVGMSIFFVSMNTVRQMLAISIAAFALPYASQKRFLPCAAIVGLAAAFHLSALFFLPVCFLMQLRWSRTQMLIFALLGTIAVILSQPLIELLLNLSLFERYRKYLDAAPQGGMVTLAVALVLFTIAFFSYECDPKARLTTSLGLLIGVSSFFIPLAGRFINTINYLNMLYFPGALISLRDKRVRFIAVAGCVGCFTVYVLYTIGIVGGQGVLPYRTIFSR